MDSIRTSRKALLDLFGLAFVASSAIVMGCGAKVAIDGEGAGSGAGGAGGGATISGGAGGLHDGGCGVKSPGAGQVQTTECFATPPEGCPNQYDAVMHIVPSTPCVYLVSVDCGPVIGPSKCCYLVTEEKKTCGGPG